MKRNMALFTVIAITALSLTGQAFAMGGGMGAGIQGRGDGNQQTRSTMHQGSGAGMHSGNAGEQGHMTRNGSAAGGSHSGAMHDGVAEHGGMNGSGQQHMTNGGDSPATQTETATPPAN